MIAWILLGAAAAVAVIAVLELRKSRRARRIARLAHRIERQWDEQIAMEAVEEILRLREENARLREQLRCRGVVVRCAFDSAKRFRVIRGGRISRYDRGGGFDPSTAARSPSPARRGGFEDGEPVRYGTTGGASHG